MLIGGVSASILLFLLARIMPGGRYSPGRMWAYIWALVWLGQGTLGRGYTLSPDTCVYVLICDLGFIISYSVASAHGVTQTVPKLPSLRVDLGTVIDTNVFRYSFWIAIVLGLGFLQLGVADLGRGNLTSLFAGSFAQFSNALTTTKASLQAGGVENVPTAITLAGTCQVCAAALSAIGFAASSGGKARKGALTFVCQFGLGFLISAVTGVRTYVLIAVLVYFAAYLATKISIEGLAFRISSRLITAGVGAVVAFLVWTVIVQSARRGDATLSHVGGTVGYLRAWFCGYMPALSVWSHTSSPAALGWGVNLGRGLLGPLGLVPQAVYGLQTPVVAIGGGATSNAMTIFRPLLLDFGHVGSVVAVIVAGFASERVFRGVLRGSMGYVVMLTAVYAAVLFSFNDWFFGYGSRVLGLLSALVVLLAAQATARHAHVTKNVVIGEV
jgi:oligosaccharide repeat unit polymerase